MVARSPGRGLDLEQVMGPLCAAALNQQQFPENGVVNVDPRARLVRPNLDLGPVCPGPERRLDVPVGVERDDAVDRARLLGQLDGVVRVLPAPVDVAAERVEALEERPAGQLHGSQLVPLHVGEHAAEQSKHDVVPHKQALAGLGRPFHPAVHRLQQSLEPAVAAVATNDR